MIEEVAKALRVSGAHAWEVTETATDGFEFYFIRDRLDQNRVRKTLFCTVNVYVSLEDGKSLGKATGEIMPGLSGEEIQEEIARLIRNASYVKNPYYTLHRPLEGHRGESAKQQGAKGNPSTDLQSIARQFLDTLFAVPQTKTEDINSMELFVEMRERHFMNSEGICVTDRSPYTMLEIIVNAREEAAGKEAMPHEIELYRMYTAGGCDPAYLQRELKKTFGYGRDRLRTVKTPVNGSMDVLFSSEHAKEIYLWYAYRCNAAHRYIGYSDCKEGEDVVEGVSGDRVTLTAKRELFNSSKNRAFDEEGAIVRDVTIIEDGVMKNTWGSRQFASYLGLDDTCIAQNYSVSGGSANEDALREGTYLEIVEFSDFQVNKMNGDIAGEIRLGYLHKGGKVTIVSGGSVSGSMRAAAKTIRMSKDVTLYDNMEIPALTRLFDLTITGAE